MVATQTDHPMAQPAPTRVSTECRNLYLHHTTVVAELAGKDEQFKQANARAHNSARTAKQAKQTLAKIRETESQLTTQLDVLKKRKLRNKLFPKKAAAETVKLQQSLEAVSEDAAVAKHDAMKAREVAKADAEFCRTLKGDADLLQASEKERRDILEGVFGGDVGSVAENRIETERDRLLAVTGKAKDKLTAQKHIYGLLKQAAVELSNARKSLFDAQLTNTVDLFSGGGIGFVAGINTQYRINEAMEMARSAGHKLEEVMVLSPRLPVTRAAKVNGGVVLAFADVVLDGFLTDLLIRATIEKSVKSVEHVLEAVGESLEAQKAVVERLNGRVRGYSDDLKRTSDELTKVRADLLQDMIAK